MCVQFVLWACVGKRQLGGAQSNGTLVSSEGFPNRRQKLDSAPGRRVPFHTESLSFGSYVPVPHPPPSADEGEPLPQRRSGLLHKISCEDKGRTGKTRQRGENWGAA